MAPEDARELIRSKATEAVTRIGAIAPYQPFVPVPGQAKRFRQEIRIWGRTDPNFLLDRGFEQTGARAFLFEADDLLDLYI